MVQRRASVVLAVVALVIALVGGTAVTPTAASQPVTATTASSKPGVTSATPRPTETSLMAPGEISVISSGVVYPTAAVGGPDGNVWFTNGGNATIGRVTTEGIVTNFGGPGIDQPTDIVVGPDGNLWFTNAASNSIGRLTMDGVASNFTGAGISAPQGITVGPDGALWFANAGNSSIGRITTAGSVSNFTDPSIKNPRSIAAGSDGALWFTNANWDGTIGRLTTSGVVTSFTVPELHDPQDIVAAPDGALWFTSVNGAAIGRVTTAGTLTLFTAEEQPAIQRPQDITVGPDGALWFTIATKGIGRITLDGVATSFHQGWLGYTPRGITAGPDGALWFGAWDEGAIVRMSTTGDLSEYRGTGPQKSGEIAMGPDGAMWITNFPDTILRVTTSGAITTFKDPKIMTPSSITAGPDGAMWFTNAGRTPDNVHAGSIGRITMEGSVSYFTGVGIQSPSSIVVGSDGALWFTNGDSFSGSIGRITTAGVVSKFASPGGVGTVGITAGSDGALWFTSYGNKSIGRITTAGVLTVFTDPSIVAPAQIVAGPDGALWFTNNQPEGSIGRITTDGVVSNFKNAGAFIENPGDIAVGQDGALWFATFRHTIGRITTTGAVTLYTSTAIQNPWGLVAAPDGGMWFSAAASIGRVQVAVPSSAPLGVAAIAGPGSATVTWSPPTTNGGTDVTGYVVTATPGNQRCVWPGGERRCVVGGLTAGTSYTFTVQAVNAAGPSAPSVPSNPVVPDPAPLGSSFFALAPQRILDTRSGTGGWNGPLVAGAPQPLHVAGGAVPSSATAVVLNVTATNPQAPSFLTAWPAGIAQPNASNLNFGAGDTTANLVTVKVGSGGDVAFANAVGATNVVADIVGYFDADAPGGGRYNGVAPKRVLDSRTPTGGWNGPLVAGAPRNLSVTAAGVPVTATAVIANITVTGSTAGSFVTAWPAGEAQPNASNLNFGPGSTVANLSVVKLSNGQLSLATAVGSTHVVVDVLGYFDPATGSFFHPVEPIRILDDRIGTGFSGPLPANTIRSLGVTGTAQVPSGATGLVANLTVTNPTTGSFVTAFPTGQVRPPSSSLNFGPGQTIPNLAMTRVGADGASSFYNQTGTVDLIADVVGYYAAS